MSRFDPASLLVARTQTADEGAIIRMAQKSRDLRAKGMDVVSLTVGEPDFDTPINIQEAATAAMKAGFTHYSPVQGIPELRAALAKKLKAENGLDYSASEISITNGAKQAIANAVLSLIDAGDEVIMLAPYWVSYEITVRFAGGTPVVLSASVEENYKVPAARIAAALSPRSKLLILNSPCNPTGALWSKAELEAIAAIVRSHPRLMVLADEIYEYILFDGEMASIGALPHMRERVITVNGLSKGFAMTGWRLGYAAAVEPITRAMTRMQSTITTGANQFVQRAGIAALEGPRDAVEAMRLRYRARRDTVLAGLRAIAGVRIGPIPATFYAFPDVSELLGRTAGNHRLDTSDLLCDWLLEEHGVATVPGTAFGAAGSIRLSFAASEADIEKALARLAKALGSLRA
ncbi:MAG: pyridoxal phosphate-dependent aminotransferase [Rhizobiales bacterium]|nr:pyridoxal phosphate-dependent aminotransferase [Hyphomicrobiales bacterium]MBI3673186.1 pyridoxal phosphate-dependent aminotransferase [Hyphomicrobiales bacterium]